MLRVPPICPLIARHAPLLALAGCAGTLPAAPPPLAAMEESLAHREAPEDEEERLALSCGGFTGATVGDARGSLQELVGEPAGVLVLRVVENSPADGAGLREGDLLLEAAAGGGEPVVLSWPSQWRKLELEAEAGDELRLVLDRAGVEIEARIEVEARLHPPDRGAVESFREEERVGVVLRTASEAEARRAGLGPGAGAVVVGLTRESPWRAAGLRFGDLLAEIDGEPVAHPQVVLDAIRRADPGAILALGVLRGGDGIALEAPLSRRAGELRSFSLPPLASYSRERGTSELSLLLGLFHLQRTPAAWRLRLLYVISLEGGDADRLVEVPGAASP